MRLLVGILLLAVLSRTALADVHPVKTVSAGLQLASYSGALNGVRENSIGPMAELALGTGRTQIFVEAGVLWTQLGTMEPTGAGFMTRGGLGARWIARSLQFEDDGAVEMILDALAGASKTWWDAGGELVRPELALGVGLQMRKFHAPHASIRFHIRVYFAPAGDEQLAARCTSGCAPATITDGGMMFSIGGAL